MKPLTHFPKQRCCATWPQAKASGEPAVEQPAEGDEEGDGNPKAKAKAKTKAKAKAK